MFFRLQKNQLFKPCQPRHIIDFDSKLLPEPGSIILSSPRVRNFCNLMIPGKYTHASIFLGYNTKTGLLNFFQDPGNIQKFQDSILQKNFGSISNFLKNIRDDIPMCLGYYSSGCKIHSLESLLKQYRRSFSIRPCIFEYFSKIRPKSKWNVWFLNKEYPFYVQDKKGMIPEIKTSDLNKKPLQVQYKFKKIKDIKSLTLYKIKKDSKKKLINPKILQDSISSTWNTRFRNCFDHKLLKIINDTIFEQIFMSYSIRPEFLGQKNHTYCYKMVVQHYNTILSNVFNVKKILKPENFAINLPFILSSSILDSRYFEISRIFPEASLDIKILGLQKKDL